MRKNNTFFKPTPLYKEFMILDIIEKNKDITQREISENVGIAVSMVNYYLNKYECNGFIKRKRYSTKTVEYFCTRKGKERIKVLNIWYLKSSQQVYISAKENITTFLFQIIRKGFRNILLYGAGEVAEIILDVIRNDINVSLKVLAVIDDDASKVDKMVGNTKIILPVSIPNIKHDGVLISSYTHGKKIYENLIKSKYNKNNIIQFFK